ncbi:MAG: NAD(P)(+) transhydrogenase (Re/Si-specific) subunit beta, partial [Phycisphaeraceae bacterium]
MLTLALTKTDYLALVYLFAAVLFIFGLKMLSGIKTARRGNMISALGMLVATAATFFYLSGETAISLIWVIIAMAIGATAGLIMAKKVPMTGMPQMVGLLNGFGGIASLLVACGDYARNFDTVTDAPWYGLLATGLATLVGGVTFTGSIMAFGKLQGTRWAPDSPVQFPTQKLLIGLLLAASLVFSFVLIWTPTWWAWPVAIAAMALVLGVLLVIGIGGADMPVVVALLNSYSGIAAAFAGFVLVHYALIIPG